MTPTLYDENEINLTDNVRFKSNGLGLLKDTIYCYIEEERNEGYEMELAYPVGSFLFEEIKGNRFIKAKANDKLDEQVFRIYYISQPINGEIIVKAEHISYLLKDNFIEKVESTGNCQTALNVLNANAAFPTRFNFSSNISMNADFKFERENFWDCIKGSEGSIIDNYGNGADIVRDNFNISIIQNAGQDNNILIAYKKNMTGFTCEEDWTGCKTKIYPFAIRDDVVYTISEKYVNSEYINRDPNPRIEKIDFSSEFEDDEEITEEKLRSLAHNYFILNELDIPKLSYKVEFVTLSKTEEFKNTIKDENIGLFDTVIIRHEFYNIDTKIRILKVKYDSLLEKYENIELNYTRPRISKNILKSIKKTEKKIDDTKEELNKNIDEAKEEAATATNNLKVTMEARDSEIELSVKGLDEKTEATIKILNKQIEMKVSEGDVGTLIQQNPTWVLIAIEDGSNTYIIIDTNGLTINNGKLVIKDSNNDRAVYMSNDCLYINDMWIYDVDKGSNFNNSFTNADEYEFSGDIKVHGDFFVSGEKDCLVKTKSYGERRIHAYETCEYYFGDLGFGKISTEGQCIIEIDSIFKEFINTAIEYHVFTQAYNGSITRIEKYEEYFIVFGEKGTEFSWELKAKRLNYENRRLELLDDSKKYINKVDKNVAKLITNNSEVDLFSNEVELKENNDFMEEISI